MLDTFYDTLNEAYLLRKTSYLLGWDQQVCMPKGGAELRGRKLAYLAKLLHEKLTDPKFVSLVEDLSAQSLSDRDAINVREVKRDIDKQRKLPKELIERRSYATALSLPVWEEARAENDFPKVLSHLEELVSIAREEADCLGYEAHPYDALIDCYEPHSTLADIKPVLLRLADKLGAVVENAIEQTKSVTPLDNEYPIDAQIALCKELMETLGFSWKIGRLDTVTHPFQSSIGYNDIRITTRYDQRDFLSSVMTALHELGHAFYEMGFDPDNEGTPMGQSVSMSIHESQSLFWEGVIGRRESFCELLSSLASKHFAEKLSPKAVWQQLNKVRRSFIRVDADRATYSLHIVVRMLLEEQLVTGDLKVKDLPEAWNELYATHVGITPHTDRLGVLQDIHWYTGSIGYFPSYALGHLYAAMFFEKFEQDMGSVDTLISNGNFESIIGWLNKNIHVHGRRFTPQQLVKEVTGRELTEDSFVNYLASQYD